LLDNGIFIQVIISVKYRYMTSIIFVTGNYRKVQSAQAALDKFGIKVLQNDLDTPEIQDKDVGKVAEYSAKFAAEKLNKAVIKVDVGFAIDALSGFPGPFSRYIGEWLGYKKILKLLEDEPNKKAKFVEAIAYCEPKGKPVSFKTETKEFKGNKRLLDCCFSVVSTRPIVS
jgi:XTP/dITP diphosphohydrolase